MGRDARGRLVGSSLSKISPRVQLVVTTVSAGALALLAILLNNPWLLTGSRIVPFYYVGSHLYPVRSPFGQIYICGFRGIYDRCSGWCHSAFVAGNTG